MTELGRYANNNVIDYVKSYKHLYIVAIIISSLLPVLVSSVSSYVVMAVEGRNVGPSPSLVTRYSLYSAAVSSRLGGGEGGGPGQGSTRQPGTDHSSRVNILLQIYTQHYETQLNN